MPLGVPEVLRDGQRRHGRHLRRLLPDRARGGRACSPTVGIEVEIIDVQTLLPFDLRGRIVESLQKTEPRGVPRRGRSGRRLGLHAAAGPRAQGGFCWLDAPPRTLTGQAAPAGLRLGRRLLLEAAAASTSFEAVYDLMHEAEPGKFPEFL